MAFWAYHILQVGVDLQVIEDYIRLGTYQPDLNDQSLYTGYIISDVWPQQPPKGQLHIFVSLPIEKGSPRSVYNSGE
jgi:hypothetical protein